MLAATTCQQFPNIMCNRILLSLLLLISAVPFTSYSQPSHSLHQQFLDFSSDESLRNASWSIEVVEAQSGKILLSHNSHLSLTPASTQKIVTTASALLLLGSDFRYSTKLLARGIIDANGILNGDLIIKGSGDPTLGASQMDDSLSLQRVFAHWLSDINASGIRGITGSIIADDSVFDREMVPRKWIWEDIGNYYGAGSSGLTVHENMYTVFFKAGKQTGEAVKVLGTEPSIAGLILHNQVSTGPSGSGDNVYIFGAPYSAHRTLTGTVPAGANRFPVKGSLHDPAEFIASVFNEYLNYNSITTPGIIISGPGEMPGKNQFTAPEILVSTWKSPTLKDIAARTNLYSHNTYAENLLKTIGYHIYSEGSVKAGTQAINEFWAEQGIDTGGMRLYDGSGLSPSNRITTKQITSILAYCSRSPVFENLKQGFPLAGVSGSLENHFINTASYGILSAKSGYLGNVRSYAGYTRMQDGTLVAFAFIVNDYNGSPAAMRNKMFKLMDAITSHNQQNSIDQFEP